MSRALARIDVGKGQVMAKFGGAAPPQRHAVSGERLALDALLDLALQEDIGGGDVTSLSTVPAGLGARGTILAKAPGVISGLTVADEVFRRVDPDVAFSPLVQDGHHVERMAPIAVVSGSARSILAGERLALNLLQRLSGIATMTARYVDAVRGSAARIVDTRKTTPGLRALEKAAVRHGGGQNHRFGLTDGVLIKDNHLAAVGGVNRVARAVALAREGAPHTLRIEVEVTTLAELEQALAAGADIVLLDNMDVATLRQAVALTGGRALLEASGGVTLDTVGEIAATGVDLISVGALTHSAPALDISLDFDVDRANNDSPPQP
jgi:nicotinate-nucleotide pyrophosphorylase (carboxylating)